MPSATSKAEELSTDKERGSLKQIQANAITNAQLDATNLHVMSRSRASKMRR
jgi:hypothetical protein